MHGAEDNAVDMVVQGPHHLLPQVASLLWVVVEICHLSSGIDKEDRQLALHFGYIAAPILKHSDDAVGFHSLCRR